MGCDRPRGRGPFWKSCWQADSRLASSAASETPITTRQLAVVGIGSGRASGARATRCRRDERSSSRSSSRSRLGDRARRSPPRPTTTPSPSPPPPPPTAASARWVPTLVLRSPRGGERRDVLHPAGVRRVRPDHTRGSYVGAIPEGLPPLCVDECVEDCRPRALRSASPPSSTCAARRSSPAPRACTSPTSSSSTLTTATTPIRARARSRGDAQARRGAGALPARAEQGGAGQHQAAGAVQIGFEASTPHSRRTPRTSWRTRGTWASP